MNWRMVAPGLVDTLRVVALDLPGHGLSAPARRHDLTTHTDAVLEVIDRQPDDRVILVGNSMGGLVCERIAATRPGVVRSLVLLSPATPPPGPMRPADLGLAARLAVQSLPVVGPPATRALTARWTPRRQVEETLALVMTDPSRVPEYLVDASVDLAGRRRSMPWAARAFAESAADVRRALMDRSGYREMIDAIDVRTTLVFGSDDRIVPPPALRWLKNRRRAWRAIELDGVGHTPMLERPDIVIREILRSAG